MATIGYQASTGNEKNTRIKVYPFKFVGSNRQLVRHCNMDVNFLKISAIFEGILTDDFDAGGYGDTFQR